MKPFITPPNYSSAASPGLTARAVPSCFRYLLLLGFLPGMALGQVAPLEMEMQQMKSSDTRIRGTETNSGGSALTELGIESGITMSPVAAIPSGRTSSKPSGKPTGKTSGKSSGKPTSKKPSSTHPVFKLTGKSYPKALYKLGTCPEFGSLHGLSAVQVLDKMRSQAKADSKTKVFLDGVFKQLGYSGFAEVKVSAITSVELPRGIVGNIGYSKMHKTLYAQLKNSPRDLMAWKYTGKNGRAIHFMKTCGNHFYFDPSKVTAKTTEQSTTKRTAVTQLTAISIIRDMRASLAYVSMYAKKEMNPNSKMQRPFWAASKSISVSISRMEAGLKTRNAEYLLACRELSRSVTQLAASWEVLQQHSGSFQINRGIMALQKAELTYRTHFGQQVARYKAGSTVTAKETAEVTKQRGAVSKLQGTIAKLKKGKGASPRLAADLDRKCATLLKNKATTISEYAQFMWQLESLQTSLYAYSVTVNEWYPEQRTAWQECSTSLKQFESASWSTDVSVYTSWDISSERIENVAYYTEDMVSEKVAYQGGNTYEAQTAYLEEYSVEQATEVVEEEQEIVAETVEYAEFGDDEMVCAEDSDDDGLAAAVDVDDDNDSTADNEDVDDDNDGTDDSAELREEYVEEEESFEMEVEQEYAEMAEEYEENAEESEEMEEESEGESEESEEMEEESEGEPEESEEMEEESEGESEESEEMEEESEGEPEESEEMEEESEGEPEESEEMEEESEGEPEESEEMEEESEGEPEESEEMEEESEGEPEESEEMEEESEGEPEESEEMEEESEGEPEESEEMEEESEGEPEESEEMEEESEGEPEESEEMEEESEGEPEESEEMEEEPAEEEMEEETEPCLAHSVL